MDTQVPVLPPLPVFINIKVGGEQVLPRCMVTARRELSFTNVAVETVDLYRPLGLLKEQYLSYPFQENTAAVYVSARLIDKTLIFPSAKVEVVAGILSKPEACIDYNYPPPPSSSPDPGDNIESGGSSQPNAFNMLMNQPPRRLTVPTDLTSTPRLNLASELFNVLQRTPEDYLLKAHFSQKNGFHKIKALVAALFYIDGRHGTINERAQRDPDVLPIPERLVCFTIFKYF